MKSTSRFYIWVALIFIFLSLTFQATSSPYQPDNRTVGYGYLDDGSILHYWNEMDDYYLNASSGIQLTNNYDEHWSHNTFCGGVKISGSWNYYCADSLPFSWSIDTDNFTYFNYTGYRDLTYIVSGTEYKIRLALRYSLLSNASYVNMQSYVKNIGETDIDNDLGFAWIIEDINIGGDIEDNYANIDDVFYDLDESQSLQFTDLGRTDVTFVNAEDEWMWFNWSPSLNYQLNITSISEQPNAPIKLLLNIGTLNVNQEKHTTFSWIDAECGWTCQMPEPESDQGMYQDEEFEMLGYWTSTGKSCPPTASIYPQYCNQSSCTYADMSSSTELSTLDNVPQAKTPSYNASWDVIGSEIGNYTIRTKCTNALGTKYSADIIDVNVSEKPEPTCTPVDISSDLTLDADNSSCFNIIADDVVFDCDNYELYNDHPHGYWAIKAEDRDNITIRNCNLLNWSMGILFNNTNNSHVSQVNIFNTSDDFGGGVSGRGIELSDSHQNLIEDVNITAVTMNTTIGTGSCFLGSLYGIKISGSNNNTFDNVIIDDVNGSYVGDLYSDVPGCQSGIKEVGQGMYIINSNNATLDNVDINEIYKDCIFIQSSYASHTNGSVTNAQYVYELYLADMYLYNVTFNKSETYIWSSSNLYVNHFFRINVTDTNYDPIESASINITNSTDSEAMVQTSTDASGLTPQFSIMEYVETEYEKTYYTPHNITANKSGYITNSTNVTIDQSFIYHMILESYANESSGRQAIMEGIQNSIPGAIIQTDQQIYVVYPEGTQTTGVFDKVATLGDQTWAFNYVTDGEEATGMSSLFTVVNVWEKSDMTYSEIVSDVESFIDETKE